MFWIAFAAAAQLSAPEPKSMWFGNDDTPVQEIAKVGFAVVKMRLTIRPNGLLEACEIEQSSGNARLDNYTCELTRRRADFRAGTDENGVPVYSVLRIPVVWTMGPLDTPLGSDLTVSVQRLPKGIRSPASVTVMFAVDEAGRISLCTAHVTPGIPKGNWALAPLACEELAKRYVAIPAKDSDGKAVRSVQNASVLFIKG